MKYFLREPMSLNQMYVNGDTNRPTKIYLDWKQSFIKDLCKDFKNLNIDKAKICINVYYPKWKKFEVNNRLKSIVNTLIAAHLLKNNTNQHIKEMNVKIASSNEWCIGISIQEI